MLFSPLVFSVEAVLPVAIRRVHGSLIVSDCKRNTLRYHCMAVNLKNYKSMYTKYYCREIVSLASIGTGEFCKRCRLSPY